MAEEEDRFGVEVLRGFLESNDFVLLLSNAIPLQLPVKRCRLELITTAVKPQVARRKQCKNPTLKYNIVTYLRFKKTAPRSHSHPKKEKCISLPLNALLVTRMNKYSE